MNLSYDGFQQCSLFLLCLALTFPNGAAEEEEKKNASKASGSFFVMSPSRQCVCMRTSDPERDRNKEIQYTNTRACTYTRRTHTHCHTLREKNLHRIIRSVALLDCVSPADVEHRNLIVLFLIDRKSVV